MDGRGIVIRIHADEQAVDWSVEQPQQLSFEDILDAIHHIVDDGSVQAFEYEDDEGERITVRGDEELQAMVSFYVSFYGSNNFNSPPLEIFAKDFKSGKRNVEDLKIMCVDENSKEMPMDESKQTTVTDVNQCSPTETVSPGSKKMSGDVRKILEGGTIQDCHLQYLDNLGAGQCGTVYSAKHVPSGMLMAVKVIPLTIEASEQSQIISELEVLHKCKSPSIICFFGAFFTEGRISICTEFMDGGSLDKYGIIPENIMGQITVAIVKGLQYLWTLKIMHRDLKPSNILVNSHGHVKLCDFGVSVQLINSIARTYIGTSAYMAPERLMGEDYRFRADVWSLGVLIFELVCGRFPYKSARDSSSSPVDLINSITKKTPPRLPPSPYSPEIVDFVSSCMAIDPNGRPEPYLLLKHRFIAKYEGGNDDRTIAKWVLQNRILKRSA